LELIEAHQSISIATVNYISYRYEYPCENILGCLFGMGTKLKSTHYVIDVNVYLS